MKKLWALFLTLILCCAMAIAQAKEPVQLDIYSINDLHGHLRASEFEPGAARLAGVLNRLMGANALLVGGGDMLSGSIDADSFEGVNAVLTMNRMGFAANCAGNHAFDYDMEVIKRQAKAAMFPVLAANITDAGGKIPAPFVPYALTECGGVQIGIIGVLYERTFDKVKPDRVAGLQLTAPAAAANRYAAELRSKGAQIVVLLAHIGGSTENGSLTGAIVPVLDDLQGIDAVVTGDSHTVFACLYNGMPVVQAGEYGKYIGHIHLLYDGETGQVTQAAAQVHQTINLPQGGDNGVAKYLQPYFDSVDAKYSRVLAYNPQFLSNEKYGASPLADYFMDLINGELQTDVTLYNGGAVRTSLPVGDVTLRDLKQVFPFDNTLYVVRLRGSDILAALEHGLGSKEIGRLRYAGLTVTADLSAPEGSRIVEARLADGKTLKPHKYYSVAVNDFLLAGGDGYASLKGAQIVRESGKDLSVMAAALAKVQTINFDYNDKRLVLK